MKCNYWNIENGHLHAAAYTINIIVCDISKFVRLGEDTSLTLSAAYDITLPVHRTIRSNLPTFWWSEMANRTQDFQKKVGCKFFLFLLYLNYINRGIAEI